MTQSRQKIVIVGATSSIAEHCARLWIKQDIELILIGRDPDRTEVVAADLRIRNPQANIRVLMSDFIDPVAIGQTVEATMAGGTPHTVLLAHGTLPDQGKVQQDLQACRDALLINGISPVLFAEAFASRLQAAGGGRLAIIGSVAGDRGRKSNYVYGAAKGLTARYVQGLQHRFAGSAIKIVLIKPGPTDTPMTAHLKQQGARLARAEDVALTIVRAIAQGRRVVYAPAKWRVIMAVIRHLPDFIFDRLDI